MNGLRYIKIASLNIWQQAIIVMGLSLLTVLSSNAAETPYDVIKQSTDRLLTDLQANKEIYKQHPEKFYQTLDHILGPVADTEGITRGIMTVRYSRSAAPAQIRRFQEVFKQSLMRFYGNALLQYSGQSIRVLPEPNASLSDHASVNMEITAASGVVYPLTYSMVKQEGRWLIRNVIINGINVGKLFRDQFAQAMRENGNDLDKTIQAWPNYVARAREAS